ncbi:MAG TPA: VCBS repeat-containing protein [Clostridia bacterium]|nr:VCBS repeat-containing protein [Clostridia bacterium]
MKITNASVALKSSHALVAQRTQTQSLTMWNATGGSLRLSGAKDADDAERAFKVELGTRRFSALGFSVKRLAAAKNKETTEKKEYSDIRLRLLEELVYLATGKRLRLRDPSDVFESASQGETGGTPQQPLEPLQGFGIVFSSTSTYSEVESMNFSATGTVETADGRSISFDMRLAMERSYYEQHSLEIRLGDAARTVDPLAINLGGGTIGLTGEKFDFDLDGDGKTENISFLTGQAGFLALDRNGDGIINSGRELFGTESGDGFQDLAAYDEDGNGWIDESDPVFSKLKVFNMAPDGSATLISLGSAGVGALYLGAVDTDFSFKQGQVLQGEMKKSSVYLKENGTAGTLHHIDLAV